MVLVLLWLVACGPPPRQIGDAGPADDAGSADRFALDATPDPCARWTEQLTLQALHQQRRLALPGDVVVAVSSEHPERVEARVQAGQVLLRAVAPGYSRVQVQGAEATREVEVEVELQHSIFASRVVETQYGEGAGFGQAAMPEVVLGPPMGGGMAAGSLHVVSLGIGGQITLGFDVDMADGPGPDLIVFENAFAGFFELGQVAVSLDGNIWHSFGCDLEPPHSGCAGVNPVLANPDRGGDPTDPEAAGGDAFDLVELGLTRARYLRITDVAGVVGGSGASGFDLDAAVILHPVPRRPAGLQAAASLQISVDQRAAPRFDLAARVFTWRDRRVHCEIEDGELATLDCGCTLTGVAVGNTVLRARLGDLETRLTVEVSRP